MELKEQVVSLELAKKLKELGVKQKSLIFYAKSPENKFRLYPLYIDPSDSDVVKISDKEKEYAAFTIAELWDKLPSFLKVEEHGYVNLQMSKLDDGRTKVMYLSITDPVWTHIASKAADACASALAHLLESNLIQP